MGCLDADLLARMGLTKVRMQEGDALFFYQLLLPICDPKRSGIKDDPRKAFYSDVTSFTNAYACDEGFISGQYGHQMKPVRFDEIVHFDGVVIRDGVLGGSRGALYRRWMKGCSMYDRVISESLSHTRFLQIKRVLKLCNNNKAPKRGQPGYDPAYKYDMIYDAIVSNCNEMTRKADLDQCGDETSCAHSGYGEAGSGILERRKGKPGLTRGMQMVMLF